MAQITNTTTLKPRDSDGTKYFPWETYPLTLGGVCSSYIVATTHGNPKPRYTLTELDPVTFAIEASAYVSYEAAIMDAKVSGSDVPRATKVIAVTDGLILRTQPKRSANSPIT